MLVNELLVSNNLLRVGTELQRCFVANVGTLAATLSMSRNTIKILLEKLIQEGQVEILRPCGQLKTQHEEEDDSVFYLWRQHPKKNYNA